MRIIILFVLLLLSAGSIGQSAPRAVNWQKVFGWKHSEIVAYVDKSSLRREIDNNKEYGYGVILFRRDYPVEITVKDKKITVTSFARYFIFDCKGAMHAPIADYYFNLNHLPAIGDDVVLAIDYSANPQDPQEMSKSNPIYKTICPTYI